MNVNYVCHPCAERLRESGRVVPLIRMAVRPDFGQRQRVRCRLCMGRVFPSHASVYRAETWDLPRLKEIENELTDQERPPVCRCRTCTTLRVCDCVYCTNLCRADEDACAVED